MKLLVPDRWKIELGNDGGYYQEAFDINVLEAFAESQGTTAYVITRAIKDIMLQLGFDVSFSDENEEFVVEVLFHDGDIGNALNFLAGEFIGVSQIGSMTLNELMMQAAINKGKELAKNDIVEVKVNR